MSFHLRIAFAILWLCCSSALSAQKIGLSMPFVNDAAPGSNKSLSVRVTNFDSIVSMQFVVRWNPAVLKYLAIDNFGQLPGLDINDFNTARALDSGYVRLLWEGPNSFPGVTAPDDATIFRLRFNVIGPDTSSSQIKFTEIKYSFPQTEFEIVKVVRPDSTLQAFNEQECDLKNGFVAVGYTVAAHEAAQQELEASVSPNPFSSGTDAQFTLLESSDVKILITDVTGRLVSEKILTGLTAGVQYYHIDPAPFHAKGTYFLTIIAGSQRCIRPLFFH